MLAGLSAENFTQRHTKLLCIHFSVLPVMDENTKLMIQLASMMMQQSQHAQQQSQNAFQLPTLQQQTTNLPNDPEKLIALARQFSNGTSEPVPTPTPTPPAAPVTTGILQPSTDQLIMAELAKQLVMNATSSNIAFMPPAKKQSAEKPATIAQIMQLQNLQNGLGSNLTPTSVNEGKLFVYQNTPKGETAITNGASPSQTSSPTIRPLAPAVKQESGLSHSRSTGGGPIRTRTASGRVLRPGIDNFNRFGTVANPGIIMHAMEVLRHRNKKKRGPKEKETFPVFMYCLPDKNSKLPKFSSLDPVERCLVDQHQQEGYGLYSAFFLSFFFIHSFIQSILSFFLSFFLFFNPLFVSFLSLCLSFCLSFSFFLSFFLFFDIYVLYLPNIFGQTYQNRRHIVDPYQTAPKGTV